MDLFNRTQPSVVFLDIRLTWYSGFDFLDAVDYKKSWIIFTTAYDQYAIKAFKYSAVDYLLKPVNLEELDRIIKNLLKEEREQGSGHRPISLLRENSNLKKISFSDKSGYKIAEIKDIAYMEAEGSYSKVHFLQDKILLVSHSLAYYEELLKDKKFIRIHRSYMVNGEQ